MVLQCCRHLQHVLHSSAGLYLSDHGFGALHGLTQHTWQARPSCEANFHVRGREGGKEGKEGKEGGEGRGGREWSEE